MSADSIIISNINNTCHYCGRYVQSPHKHHIFGGPNRKISDRYGLWVWLCPHHHRLIHDSSKVSKEMMQYYHELGQRAFEEWYMEKFGESQEKARKEFMRLFMKNWL